MATNNSNNNTYTNNADGFALAGGTTARTLTLTAGNVTLSAGGANTYTMPSATDTLVGRASTDTLTNKTMSISSNTFQFSPGVNTQANAGTAGGTINYINLGGIKMAWGFISFVTLTAGSDSAPLSITLPTSFFSNITGINAAAIGNNVAWGTQINATINSYSASSVSVQLHNFGGGTTGNVGMSYTIIGN